VLFVILTIAWCLFLAVFFSRIMPMYRAGTLREVSALKKFKDLMRRNAGKHKFEGLDE
jgi:hypothetical protein